ncbi:MAG TPA: ADP-ribosylglycohydrolase family protein [Verrucomicrobiae bacterium]|nr:ADP-ribosylglycohydrolase family protein [Verrucomicrobiae bacterium]
MTRPASNTELSERFAGLLLGTAVGDALGLPAEGISRSRSRRMWQGRWRHRFFFGRGMISDDTEHTLFVAQALLAHPDDVDAFQRCLAWKLRLWLLGVPAGIGLATLRSILKLWLGFSPKRSGVASAGNGPAMRSAIIGLYFADDPQRRLAFVLASTRLTHTDQRAETAAIAVAEAAAWAMNQNVPVTELPKHLPALEGADGWVEIRGKMAAALTAQMSVQDFAGFLGLQHGVTGYAYHTVPVALYAAFRHGDDFRQALESALNCGGDTDTVGAIVGAVAGAKLGRQGVPADLISGICEWPRSMSVMERIAVRLAEQKQKGVPLGPVRYFWPGLIPRNIFFVIVVLLHGFRRLAPPY